MSTESLVILIISITSITMSLSLFIFSYFDKRRNELRRLDDEERLHQLLSESRKYYEMNYSYSPSKKKGFSDEYEESLYLLRRLRNDLSNFKSEIRNACDSNLTDVDSHKIASDIIEKISDNLKVTIDTENLSRSLLHEFSNQMTLEHFLELKKSNIDSKIHDTYKTLQHVQHILRTPLSGIKINVKSLIDKNANNDEELTKLYNQIESAIGMIESNMRTLTSYCIDDTDSTLNLKEILSKYLSLLLLTSDKKINLNVEKIDPELLLPQCVLDDVLLCVACLVENATSFALDNSEIIIECTISDNNYIISVTNSGSIISEENKDNIFEDGFSTRGSSGIGLHIVKTIVNDKLNGELFFENLVDSTGVKFYFTFEVLE